MNKIWFRVVFFVIGVLPIVYWGYAKMADVSSSIAFGEMYATELQSALPPNLSHDERSDQLAELREMMRQERINDSEYKKDEDPNYHVYENLTHEAAGGFTVEGLIGILGTINSIIMGWYVVVSNHRKSKAASVGVSDKEPAN